MNRKQGIVLAGFAWWMFQESGHAMSIPSLSKFFQRDDSSDNNSGIDVDIVFGGIDEDLSGRSNEESEKPGMQVNSDMTIDWNDIKHFRAIEFANVELMHPSIIYAADAFREELGCPTFVSPAKGATARTYGSKTSQHYAVGRLSTAVDLIPIGGCTLEDMYNAARRVPAIGGIGLYPDWNPRPGIHIDTRPKTNGKVASWMGRKNIDGSQYYTAIDWSYIRSIT